jgi:hypothetical protein
MERNNIAINCDLIHPTRRALILKLTFISKASVEIHFRSEPYDFQRGEVEWEGGNLYFDKWDYTMKVKYGDK